MTAATTTPTKFSLHAAYAVDKQAAQYGRWFDFPELGEVDGNVARLLLASTKCNPDYKACRERHFKTKYWDRGKQAPQNLQDAKAPLIYAEAIVRGMENVALEVGRPALADTYENRVKLLKHYEDPLFEDIDAIANELSNYRPAELMDRESQLLDPAVAAEIERSISAAEREAGVDVDPEGPAGEAEAASGKLEKVVGWWFTHGQDEDYLESLIDQPGVSPDKQERIDAKNPLLKRPALLEFLVPVWNCWLYVHSYFREYTEWGSPRPLQPVQFEWYATVEELTEAEVWRVRRYLPVLDREYRRLETERRGRETPGRDDSSRKPAAGRR